MDVRRKLVLPRTPPSTTPRARWRSRRAALAGGLGATEGIGICHSYTPDGRCVSLLKILLTNFCIYDCKYCTSRVSSDVERARFEVEEVVRLTLDFYRQNAIEGLFPSSGVLKSPDYTMEQMVAVARRCAWTTAWWLHPPQARARHVQGAPGPRGFSPIG